jgi:hypothetical protein
VPAVDEEVARRAGRRGAAAVGAQTAFAIDHDERIAADPLIIGCDAGTPVVVTAASIALPPPRAPRDRRRSPADGLNDRPGVPGRRTGSCALRITLQSIPSRVQSFRIA